jgi:septum site-determining protein MinC
MTAANTDHATSAVPLALDIKSAQLPLLALFLKTEDLTALAQDLAARFGPEGESPDFFDHEGAVLDFSRLSPDAAVDMPDLLSLLRGFSLRPIAIRGASPVLTQAALDAGLVLAPELARPVARPVVADEAVMEAAVVEPVVVEMPVDVAESVPQVTPTAPTLVIDKPLRSGQKAYARGGDLVVLAMVNQGAEVVADGNIHVYAPLRGKAMAGARGNIDARIFALSMEPELISIAGIYRTSEKPLPADIHGKPAQIRLGGPEDDKLIFEPLSS